MSGSNDVTLHAPVTRVAVNPADDATDTLEPIPTTGDTMNTRRTSILAAATIATLVLAACGTQRSTDNASPATGDGRTVIEVTMTDIAFTPTTIAVRAGETVTLRFRNDGQIVHEAVIGDAALQQEHADEMAAMGTSDTMNHGNPDEATPLVLKPGQTGEMTLTALAAGGLLIGCHQPGHWEAGMKASIDVI